MLRTSLVAALALAATAGRAAADITLVKGGPKSSKALVETALLDAERAMAVCWRGSHPASLKISLATAADGSVTARPVTKGGAAQCAAGILAVWSLPGGAWSGDVEITPGAAAPQVDVSAVIQKQLLARSADIKACQAEAPSAAGSVTIRMTVETDGKLSDVVASSKLGTAIDNCVTRAVAKLRLDPPGTGGPVKYQLAVAFGGGGASTPPPADGGDPTGGSVGGTLPVSDVKTVMNGARARIGKCAAAGKTKGTVTVRWTIRADGTTKNVVVKEPIGDAAIETCLTKLVAGLKFPSASGETRVSYPFALR